MTQEEKNEIIKLTNEGKTAKEIISITGHSKSSVYRIIVGKSPTTIKRNRIKELRTTGKTLQEIANDTGLSRETVKKKLQYIRRTTSIDFPEEKRDEASYVNGFLSEGFRYDSGYTNCESSVNIKCLSCGTVFTRNMTTIRRRKQTRCPVCQKGQRAKAYNKICIDCGEKFESHSPSAKYCVQCCDRRRGIDRGRFRRSAYKYDNSISLAKLYRRDNGICHICGKRCDYNDKIFGDRRILAGNLYPSIDHVIPLSKGGNHSWDNVKLAHRVCNSKKGDQ